jgi:hypothetical protein
VQISTKIITLDPGHEIQTLTSKLPFSDDSFKVYACRAIDLAGRVLDEDKVS